MSPTGSGLQLEIKTDFYPYIIEVDGAVNFGLLVNELMLNATKHAFKDREL
ncbi:MAG: hypothetical protein JXQ90_08740 [Cyclobacteriaceae bacterium]